MRGHICNTPFQASSLLLGLYRPVYVAPGQNYQRPVFSRQGSYDLEGHSEIHVHVHNDETTLKSTLTIHVLQHDGQRHARIKECTSIL